MESPQSPDASFSILVTPQDIADFENERMKKRLSLTLFSDPVNTIVLFLRACASLTTDLAKTISAHWSTHLLIIPLALVWLLDKSEMDHPFLQETQLVAFVLEYTVWWVGLGVLSSIGFGMGLQSGMLFLYPHVFATVLAAQSCNSTNFVSETNMWFRNPANLYVCPAGGVSESSAAVSVDYWDIWYKIFPSCFLQAAGTALGEIPPYWMTRAARLATIDSGVSKPDDIPEELDIDEDIGYAFKAKLWMMQLLRDHGFLGVLLMASFPNFAFDLCGVCCGHFLMPFWVFFGATFIGKALIRNGYQSLLYVAICNEAYLENIIHFLQRISPDSLHVDQRIRDLFEEIGNSFQRLQENMDENIGSTSKNTSRGFKFYYQCIMGIFVTLFLLNFIGAVAQFHQMKADDAESRQLRANLPESVRKEITSPKSARLRLPPPSPISKSKGPRSSSSFSSLGKSKNLPLNTLNDSLAEPPSPVRDVGEKRIVGQVTTGLDVAFREYSRSASLESCVNTPERRRILPKRACKRNV